MGGIVIADCPNCSTWEHNIVDMVVDDDGTLRETQVECRLCGCDWSLTHWKGR